MEFAMLLLVSAVAQLVSSAAVNPSHRRGIHLNPINKLIVQYNASDLSFFVEDVQQLVDDGCKNQFFCKVENILENHYNNSALQKKQKEHEEIVIRNLKNFVRSFSDTCEMILKDVQKSDVTKPITKLLGHLVDCCRRRRFYASTLQEETTGVAKTP